MWVLAGGNWKTINGKFTIVSHVIRGKTEEEVQKKHIEYHKKKDG